MFDIKEDGKNRAVYFVIEKMNNRAHDGIKNAFFQLGPQIKRDIQDEILYGKKTGYIYKFPVSRFEKTKATEKQLRKLNKGRGRKNAVKYKNHLASAPGETAANISGFLRKGVGYNAEGYVRLTMGVDERVKYARKLELGYKEGNRVVKPRPNIKNGINKNIKTIESRLENEVKKSLLK